MKSFLKRAADHSRASTESCKKRRENKLKAQCAIYGRLVAKVPSATNVKYTVAPFHTQPAIGKTAGFGSAFLDAQHMFFMRDGESYEPVCNFATEAFSATAFARDAASDSDVKRGDVVKMTGVRMKRAGDKLYYNCDGVKPCEALPHWNVQTPDIPYHTIHLPLEDLGSWQVHPMKRTKQGKPYCQLTLYSNHVIMLWKEYIDAAIECVKGFEVTDYDKLDMRDVLQHCVLECWGSCYNLVSIQKSPHTPIGFDPEKLASDVLD